MKNLFQNVIVWFKDHKKTTIIIIIIICIILFKIFFSSSQKTTFEEYTTSPRDLVEEVTIAGSIDSVARANLGFKTSGRVARIYALEGETVTKDQKIATLNVDELYADIQAAQAELDIARADSGATAVDLTSARQNLEDTIAQQQTLVDNAYQNLLTNDLQAYLIDSSDDETLPTVSGTYTGMKEGKYVLRTYSSGGSLGYSFRLDGLEKGTYKAEETATAIGTKGLYVSFDPNGDYGRVEYIISIPNTRSSSYQIVKNAYEDALRTQELAVSNAQKEYDRIKATENGIVSVSKSKALVNSKKAQVIAAQSRLENAQIFAPFDGILAKVDLEIGEIVSANEEPITMITDNAYEMIVLVPEIDVAKIAIDDVVDVTLDARPDLTWEGIVRHIDIIDTQVDGVPVYETTVEIVSPSEVIRVGMNARARIQTSKVESVLAIPVYFIEKKDGESFVRVYKGEEDVVHRVETGVTSSDGFVEVITGLSDGEIVIRKFEE